MEGEEPCDHHDAQVAVRMVELDGETHECSWCPQGADGALVKSQRHKLFLCDECTKLLRILMGAADD